MKSNIINLTWILYAKTKRNHSQLRSKTTAMNFLVVSKIIVDFEHKTRELTFFVFLSFAKERKKGFVRRVLKNDHNDDCRERFGIEKPFRTIFYLNGGNAITD